MANREKVANHDGFARVVDVESGAVGAQIEEESEEKEQGRNNHVGSIPPKGVLEKPLKTKTNLPPRRQVRQVRQEKRRKRRFNSLFRFVFLGELGVLAVKSDFKDF
jgi:hypothetical protein